MADSVESTDVQGVHGLVALNPDGTAIGTPVGGATSANQTNGTQKTQIVDAGGEAVTVTGGKLDVNATASLAGQSIPATGATEAVTVQVVDGSGNQIASFGGGTQYTEGDTDASLTGTVAMAEGPSSTATPLQVDASNHLQIDIAAASTALTVTDGGGSVTVDNNGTFATQAAQSGTWNITNVSGTVSLPTGASTAANQATIIGHVDGIETLLGTIDTDTGAIATSAASIDTKTPALGQALAAASVPVILPAATITTLTPPAAITGFATEAKQDTLIGHVDGIEGLLTTIDADTGNIATEVAGLLTDTELRATPVVVDLGANNDVTVTSGTVTANAGTNLNTSALALETGGNLAAAATSLATLDNIVSGSEAQVDIVASLPAGTNNIGDVDILSTVPPTPSTSGGYDIFRSLDLDESEEDVKTSAGKLYGYYFFNKAATSMFLKFYNATAASVTVGTTTPVLTLGLPAGGAGHIEFSTGIPFSTAISAAVTTGIADNDTGAPAANDVSINIFYK